MWKRQGTGRRVDQPQQIVMLGLGREGLDMLPADGRVLFYARSRDYWRAEPISKELVARGRMRHVETFKTLEIYVKG